MKNVFIIILFISSYFTVAQEFVNDEIQDNKKTFKELREEQKQEQKIVYDLGYPRGIYSSMTELLLKQPSDKSKLIPHARASAAIKQIGGNDYKLYKSGTAFGHNKVNKTTFAYSNGKELFINGLNYNLQFYFCKVVSDGRFLVFKAGIPNKNTKGSEQMKLINAKAVKGQKITGAQLAMVRFVYVMDKKTGELQLIDQNNILKFLADAPASLIERYNNESQKANSNTILKYITEYNLTTIEKVELINSGEEVEI